MLSRMLQHSRPHPNLRSFPTRRSSDLGRLKDPSTIDALIAACKAPDQQVHVLRSLADALGAMGPAGSAALPTLQDLTKIPRRSEEHTSELQSLRHLVCRLLLEKKKTEK